MFVELIEALRCPREHEAGQLVASATRSENRQIVEGVLGCPVCGAEFLIEGGVATFDDLPNVTAAEPPSVETAMRIAAFLELTDTRGFVLLCGTAGSHASALFQLSETPVVLLNPPAGVATPSVVGVVHSRRAVPFARASVRAVALDVSMSDDLVRSAVGSVRPGGRLMGPARMPVPRDVMEIVRDERDWVGHRATEASGPPQRLITLSRATRP